MTVTGAGCGSTAQVREAVATARAALETAGLSTASQVSLIAALDQLVAVHRAYAIVSDPFRPVLRARLRGEPEFHVVRSALIAARENLAIAMGGIVAAAVRPDGYTAAELRHEAGIGETLWQQLRKRAGIEVARGQSQRRFTNAEISRLIQVARDHHTRDSNYAADAWQRLLDANRTAPGAIRA